MTAQIPIVITKVVPPENLASYAAFFFFQEHLSFSFVLCIPEQVLLAYIFKGCFRWKKIWLNTGVITHKTFKAKDQQLKLSGIHRTYFSLLSCTAFMLITLSIYRQCNNLSYTFFLQWYTFYLSFMKLHHDFFPYQHIYS